MAFEIEITREADLDLKGLRAFHRSEILDAMDEHLRHAPTQISRSRIKRLRFIGSPAYRLRIGDYRVYYDVDENEEVVTILRVLHKYASLDYLRVAGGES